MRLPRWMAIGCLLAAGCSHAPPPEVDLKSDLVRLHGSTANATYACTVEFESGFFDGNLAALSADIGRCHVTVDDDGQSRLEYPTRTTTRPTATAPSSATVEIGPAGPFGGDLPLIGDADHPTRFPDVHDLGGVAFGLPLFMEGPFDVLPDRLATALAGPAPVAPALVDLARELADTPAVTVVGTLRDTGIFAGQMSVSAAGRAKLRAALDRRPGVPTTKPT